MESESASTNRSKTADSLDCIDIVTPLAENTCPGTSDAIPMERLNSSALEQNGGSQVKNNLWVQIESEPVIEYEMNSFVKVVKQRRLLQKLVYMFSVFSIILLTHSLLEATWLLPYYYSVSAPVLLFIRIIMYCNYKWQYFLLEFCYVGLVMLYMFIWALPYSPRFFAVVFSLSNGPLLWGMGIYQNSFVFHNIEKVTSVFIHFFPAILCFVIRWYPVQTSRKWYVPFLSRDWEMSLVWLVVIPVGCVGLHNCVYNVIVHMLLKPSEDHITSFKFFIARKESDMIVKAFNIFGTRWRIFVYNFLHVLVCGVSMFASLLWYNYFIAHCVFLSSMFTLTIYNGANYYMDVFSVRGFESVHRG
ncbi:glycerophosphocholine acyltransferase 1-like [Gigantopelta aegis]|uniref:glycerophosphocholine acyltransferase 1-like n=1 Tax=Gigantopelta aegis TaxID=1735272 RepID=UPI001B88E41F|nr:glycerophosphocholine acyltransferase 1-like [Gigantopelta aegis]XP_041370188.1 glycerophosphocholine acyltransferase 1-like [Gigantopelta aegis]